MNFEVLQVTPEARDRSDQYFAALHGCCEISERISARGYATPVERGQYAVMWAVVMKYKNVGE
jgi:hypothetical protein